MVATAALLALLGVPASGTTLSAASHRRSTKTVPIPAFSIEVRLSDAAAREIRESGETIVVRAWFDGSGEPLPGVKQKAYRSVYLGDHRVELGGAGVATFEGVRVRADDVQRLDDKNFHVNINVFTGRCVFGHNLLTGGSTFGRIEDMQGTTTVAHCRLIRE